jgi:hypothetical protein
MKQAIAKLMTAVAMFAPAVASAMPITSMDQMEGKSKTTIFFQELLSKDGKVFGTPELGQPYSRLGLVLPSQMVDARANMIQDQPVAVKSTGISTIDNANYQTLAFTSPRAAVGFSVLSAKATSIIVTALDKDGNTVEQITMPASTETRFVGFAFKEAVISAVRVVAPHETMGDAIASPTLITGITFVSTLDGPISDTVGFGSLSDTGLAQAVGAPGAGSSGDAFASAGGGFGGGGGAGRSASPRNPGNRNPNLPPTVIPEPQMLAAGIMGAAFFLRRRH